MWDGQLAQLIIDFANYPFGELWYATLQQTNTSAPSRFDQRCPLLVHQLNGMIVATLTHEQMIEILRRPGSVMAVIVPPLPNGKPRKWVKSANQLSLVHKNFVEFLSENLLETSLGHGNVTILSRPCYERNCNEGRRIWPEIGDLALHLVLVGSPSFQPCPHLDFESAVIAENDKFYAVFNLNCAQG